VLKVVLTELATHQITALATRAGKELHVLKLFAHKGVFTEHATYLTIVHAISYSMALLAIFRSVIRLVQITVLAGLLQHFHAGVTVLEIFLVKFAISQQAYYNSRLGRLPISFTLLLQGLVSSP